MWPIWKGHAPRSVGASVSGVDKVQCIRDIIIYIYNIYIISSVGPGARGIPAQYNYIYYTFMTELTPLIAPMHSPLHGHGRRKHGGD